MKKEKVKVKKIGSLKFASVINILNAILCVLALVFMVSVAFLSHNKIYETVFGWNDAMLVLFGFIIFPILLIISFALILFYSIMFSGCLVSFVIGLINGICVGEISKSEINPYQYKGKRALSIVSIILSVILIGSNIAFLCNMTKILETFGTTANQNNLKLLKYLYITILIISCITTFISLIILLVNMIKNWRKAEKDENGKLISPSEVLAKKSQTNSSSQSNFEKVDIQPPSNEEI